MTAGSLLSRRRGKPTAPEPSGGPARIPGARRPIEDGNAPARKRESFFDNAKFLAIVLVVLGHAWEPLIDDSRAARALYLFVYAFHMPAFIIVSGYFSRSFDGRADRLQRLITGVVVPYIVFETAYSLFKRYIGGDADHPVSLLDPWYLTWFLIALTIWRLTAPIWRIVRWPLPLALAIAALAGTSAIGDDLDLQRVLQFLPFFVLGLHLRPEHFALVRSWRVRLLALPVFAAAVVFAYWAAPRMTAAWFYRRADAEELGVSAPVPIVMTCATFVCALVLVAGFFSWVPGRRLWITSMGAATMYVYLLHGFVIKGAGYAGWYDHEFVHTPQGAVTVTLLAVALAVLLASPPVRALFRPLVEPRMDWAFSGQRTARRPSPAGRPDSGSTSS